MAFGRLFLNARWSSGTEAAGNLAARIPAEGDKECMENRNCWVVGEFTSCPLGELSSCLCCVEVPHLGLLPSMCVG